MFSGRRWDLTYYWDKTFGSHPGARWASSSKLPKILKILGLSNHTENNFKYAKMSLLTTLHFFLLKKANSIASGFIIHTGICQIDSPAYFIVLFSASILNFRPQIRIFSKRCDHDTIAFAIVLSLLVLFRSFDLLMPLRRCCHF